VIYAATTERSIAIVLLAVVVVGWAIYVFVNIRRSKSEVGSEIELAANRGSLPDDDALEGNRLERVQAFGVLMLLIIALALPVYWLREGGRRSGAERGFSERAAAAGERLAEELECVVCHGADLGGANYAPVVLDIGNQFSDQDTYIVKTTWRAPALDTVFARFDTDAETLDEVDEIRQILNYGRGVMPAWGLPGGGPLTPQQVDNLIAWLWRERLSDEEASDGALVAKQSAMAAHPEKTEGQVLFELHCARCHTPRWPARGPAQLPNNGGEVQIVPGPAGSGRYGPALNTVSLERLFPDIEDQISFIATGAADNVAYGEFARLGNYGMPGFGRVLSDDEIRAIVEYERSLDPAEQTTVQFTELHTKEDNK
jgi:mono/diheme cytochrome c family protein|tara:strand:+ start:633 stop:1745 length:1113 start_codon:yes stop_codon:yes gene_type:complete